MSMAKYYILIFSSFFLLLAHGAAAAVIYVLPEQGNFARGETVDIDIKIDSEGEGINAAQGYINWSAGVLEFIEASKEDSAFNFWLEEPALLNASTSLSFIVGTAKGISGGALQVFRLKFRAMSTGTVEFLISEAAVTASDGKGTNVLSKVKGASFRVGLETTQPELPDTGSLSELSPVSSSTPISSSTPVSSPIPQPVRVERQATSASGIPQKPEIQVPQYPDEKQWYNYLGDVTMFWNVPSDITAVASALDYSPNFVPSKAEKELTTGRNFGILTDGVWYVHARFRNNIGWGPTAHFRLAIDTQPPLPFEIVVLEGETTDNPAPVIQFRSSDALSGLKEYEITIDGQEAIQFPVAEFMGNFTLPLQTPGAHTIVVRAIDEAGNSVEDSVAIEIIPIPSPTITFVTEKLFSEEEQGLNVKGIALPNINVLLKVEQVLEQEKDKIILTRTVQADDSGNWELTFNEPLRNGRYVVTAQSQDVRGALSLVVESSEILVNSKPIIQIGFLHLGRGGAALLLLFLLLGGFVSGVWFYKKRQEKLVMRVGFTESEITKIFKLIMNDVGTLSKTFETPDVTDDKYALKRLQENIKKMEGYLKKEVEKIKK